MDDDKRRLRLYQEQYLADGDLHTDGPGRARRFRWKNIGAFTENSQPPHSRASLIVMWMRCHLEFSY